MAQFYADRLSVGSHQALTPEGFLLVTEVPIARTGFQTYRAEEVDKDGSLGLSGLVDVYRPREEVLSAATLASFEGKTITCPHPPQFLNPNNDGHYYRGHVQNVRAGAQPLADGEWPIVADLLIKDGTTISQVQNKHFAELSAGYSYDLVPYDAGKGKNVSFMQKNIRGNHVALVQAGRAGSDVRILDSSPEEGNMEQVVEKKTGLLSEIGSFFRDLKDSGFRLVAVDAAESETVKRQEEIAKKSNSLKERTLDMKTVKDADELEKEDEGAEAPKKKAKDEKEEEKREASDATQRKILEGIDTLVKLAKDAKAKDEEEEEEPKKKAEDADEEEEEEKEKKSKSEDSDLIPVATLSGKEIPENPIPGADVAIAGLRKLRPAIAAMGSREATDTFNTVMLALKGKLKATDSGYKKLLGTKKPEAVKTAEDRARLTVTDAKENADEGAADFFEGAKKFHRQNPTEVKLQ